MKKMDENIFLLITIHEKNEKISIIKVCKNLAELQVFIEGNDLCDIYEHYYIDNNIETMYVNFSYDDSDYQYEFGCGWYGKMPPFNQEIFEKI